MNHFPLELQIIVHVPYATLNSIGLISLTTGPIFKNEVSLWSSRPKDYKNKNHSKDIAFMWPWNGLSLHIFLEPKIIIFFLLALKYRLLYTQKNQQEKTNTEIFKFFWSDINLSLFTSPPTIQDGHRLRIWRFHENFD